MTDQTDVAEVSKGEVKKKKRFDARDWKVIADQIVDEYEKRKKARKNTEKEWAEIDRQLRMEPNNKLKLLADGTPDRNRAWMAEMELPFQAQALEVLTADARRLMFPDSGPWFAAHAALTDQYLSRVDFQSMIAGDENDIPSQINQDNADKIVESLLNHYHRQYDFGGVMDLVNAEAFKYGTGLARVKMAQKSVIMQTARGTLKETQTLPVILPRSIKETYLDETEYAVMNEGLVMGPSVIAERDQKVVDLVLAANKGSTDPDKEIGGWMPSNLKGLEGDKDGCVCVLEYEGDLIVPRKTTGSMFLPGVIVTVARGYNGDKADHRVIRFRFRKIPMQSYVQFPYHKEHIDCAYATSPLMKGRIIQAAATDALNRYLDAAALKNQPPMQYNRDDMVFAQSGGPRVFPGAQWGTTDKVEVVDMGDIGPMLNAYLAFVKQHSDFTGMNAPRLGEQTVSHTTAYAKQSEIQRGTVRTVDYVKASLEGPLTQILALEYEIGKEAMKGTMRIYSESYRGWLDLKKEFLPDDAVFDAYGAGGPAEQQQKNALRLQSLQLGLQMDQIAAQYGQPPTINIPAAIEQVLREGGWTDINAIARIESVASGNQAASAVPTTPQSAPATPATALQALAGQAGG